MKYLEDSYLKECEATVDWVNEANKREVSLDQTIFYPRGGGQPSDLGTINDIKVVNVAKKEGRVVHELATENLDLVPGTPVHCVLDWPRRYKLMRMHTAAHVLAAIMCKEMGVLISGNQLDTDKTRFDFTMAEFDRDAFEKVVQKTNEALSKDIELKIYTLPREEAMKIDGVVKLANALPPSISTLRIVEIPGIDIQADGGTHVKSLREVGEISILKLENKGKDNRRIYFSLNE